MTRFYRSSFLAGLALCWLSMPRISHAITGCTNTMLTGNYNAEVSSLNLQSVLNKLNGNASGVSDGGFGSNPASISGSVPGLGRFFFDGNGSIVGVTGASGNQQNMNVGTYTVNDNCSATIKLSSGQ